MSRSSREFDQWFIVFFIQAWSSLIFLEWKQTLRSLKPGIKTHYYVAVVLKSGVVVVLWCSATGGVRQQAGSSWDSQCPGQGVGSAVASVAWLATVATSSFVSQVYQATHRTASDWSQHWSETGPGHRLVWWHWSLSHTSTSDIDDL